MAAMQQVVKVYYLGLVLDVGRKFHTEKTKWKNQD